MIVRFGGVLSLLLVVTFSVSSSALADTIFQCSETWYEKNGSNPYDVPHFFIFENKGFLSSAKLRWENKKIDLSVTTDSSVTIEAVAKTTAHMPLPDQIDRCVNDDVAARPELRHVNGTVNIFTVLGCTTRAETSDQEVPIDIVVTINRVTAELSILRRQDNSSQHDTKNYGSCKVSKPVL
jgi:nitrate reductase alpha subunit